MTGLVRGSIGSCTSLGVAEYIARMAANVCMTVAEFTRWFPLFLFVSKVYNFSFINKVISTL